MQLAPSRPRGRQSSQGMFARNVLSLRADFDKLTQEIGLLKRENSRLAVREQQQRRLIRQLRNRLQCIGEAL